MVNCWWGKLGEDDKIMWCIKLPSKNHGARLLPLVAMKQEPPVSIRQYIEMLSSWMFPLNLQLAAANYHTQNQEYLFQEPQALWAFICFHFGFLGFHFLSFWPFGGTVCVHLNQNSAALNCRTFPGLCPACQWWLEEFHETNPKFSNSQTFFGICMTHFIALNKSKPIWYLTLLIRFLLPVVPHKAVAEVSDIGKL